MTSFLDLVNQQWAVLLPVILGALAIAVLLPRPKKLPLVLGILLGLPALGLGLFLLVPVTGPGWIEPLLFFVFSGLALFAGVALVTVRTPARGAMAFALVVLSVSGLFLLLAAPFLMASTVIVYAGAIIVTFMFVLMLAQPLGYSDADARSHAPTLASLTGFLLLAALLLAINNSYGSASFAKFEAQFAPVARAAAAESLEEAEAILVRESSKDLFETLKQSADQLPPSPARQPGMGSDNDLSLSDVMDELPVIWDRATKAGEAGWNRSRAQLARVVSAVKLARATAGTRPPRQQLRMSPWSGPPANQPLARDPSDGRPLVPAANVAAIGRSLFSDYLLSVELGGTLLLIATIGAIAIAGHRRREAKV